jgi:hypothetical protein
VLLRLQRLRGVFRRQALWALRELAQEGVDQDAAGSYRQGRRFTDRGVWSGEGCSEKLRALLPELCALGSEDSVSPPPRAHECMEVPALRDEIFLDDAPLAEVRSSLLRATPKPTLRGEPARAPESKDTNLLPPPPPPDTLEQAMALLGADVLDSKERIEHYQQLSYWLRKYASCEASAAWLRCRESVVSDWECPMTWSGLQRRFGGGQGWYVARWSVRAAMRLVKSGLDELYEAVEGGIPVGEAFPRARARFPGFDIAAQALLDLCRRVSVDASDEESIVAPVPPHPTEGAIPWRPLVRGYLSSSPWTALDMHLWRMLSPQHMAKRAWLQLSWERCIASSSEQVEPDGDTDVVEDSDTDTDGEVGAEAAHGQSYESLARTLGSTEGVTASIIVGSAPHARCMLELDLSWTPKLGKSTFDLMAKTAWGLARGLRAVDLGYTPLGRDGLAVVCRAMAGSRSLRRLSLPCCKLGAWAGPAVAQLARTCPRLSSLSLSFNALRAPGVAAICELIGGTDALSIVRPKSRRRRSPSPSLRRPSTATDAPPRGSFVGSLLGFDVDSSPFLDAVFGPHPRLTALQLRSTSMGAAGCIALGRAIRARVRAQAQQSPTVSRLDRIRPLVWLDVADNHITTTGASQLASTLRFYCHWSTSQTVRTVLPDFPDGIDTVWSERLMADSAVVFGHAAMSEPSFMSQASGVQFQQQQLQRLHVRRAKLSSLARDSQMSGSVFAMESIESLQQPSLVTLASENDQEDWREGDDHAVTGGPSLPSPVPDWIAARYPVQHRGRGGRGTYRAHTAGLHLDEAQRDSSESPIDDSIMVDSFPSFDPGAAEEEPRDEELTMRFAFGGAGKVSDVAHRPKRESFNQMQH